jgi:hypothetical protein
MAIVILSTSCCKEEPDTLSVSPAAFTFTADDTKEESATITTNADAWNVEATDNWVIYRREGDKLHLSVQNYNETGAPRETDILVTAGAAEPFPVKITQSARDNLAVNPESLEFAADATGSREVSIETNVENWEATTDASWITLSRQNKTLTVSVSKNTDTRTRSGAIKITAGNAFEKTVTVTQAEQHTLSVSPTTLSFAANETGERTLTVTTSASEWAVSSDASWVKTTKQSNTLRVSVSANTGSSDRSAKLTFTAGNATPVTVTVTQEKQHTLSVSPTSLSFTASAAEKSVTVTTTATSWDATETASWITISKQSNTLSVSASANTSTSSRSATITVTAGNAPSVTVSVTQAGQAVNTLSVSPTSLSFTATETSQKTVTVTTDASSWSSTSGASWITISKQSNTLRVSVSANTSTSSRSATLTVTAGNAPSRTVSVTQAGQSANTLSVSPTSLSFTATETAQKTVTVTTNASSWNATSGSSWVTLTKQSNALRVSVSANTGSSSRSATITVTAGTAPSRTVSVTQQANSSSSTQVTDGIYTGRGTPSIPGTPGPSTWDCLILNNTAGTYFTIASWAGVSGLNVRCNYKNSKIYMDGSTMIGEDNTHRYYFRVGNINGNTLTVAPASYEYAVTWNSSSRVLDFSGTYSGRTAIVGIVGFHKSTGALEIVLIEMYANLRLTLDISLASSQISGDAVVKAGEVGNYKIQSATLLEMTSNSAAASSEKRLLKKVSSVKSEPK